VKNLGADEVIDYESETLEQKMESVNQKSDKNEVWFDVVLDTVGSNATRTQAARILKEGGRYVCLTPPLLRRLDQYGLFFGVPAALADWMFQQFSFINNNNNTNTNTNTNNNILNPKKVHWGFYRDALQNGAILAEIAKLIEKQLIRPNIDTIYPNGFEQPIEAHKYLENGRPCGKVVLKIR